MKGVKSEPVSRSTFDSPPVRSRAGHARNAKVMFRIQKRFLVLLCSFSSLDRAMQCAVVEWNVGVGAHSKSSHASLKLSLPSVRVRPSVVTYACVDRNERASERKGDVHGKK